MKKNKKRVYRWDIGINGGVSINNPIVDESLLVEKVFRNLCDQPNISFQ